MPAAQAGPDTADIGATAEQDADRLAGAVGEYAPEQVLAFDHRPVTAAADPPGDLDDLATALVEHDLGGRSAQGDAQRPDRGAPQPPPGRVIGQGGRHRAPPDLIQVDAES